MAKKDTGQKAVEERFTSGGWAKEDDPIYKQGWTIAPNMSGRQRAKESKSSNQDRQKISEDAP